MSVDLTGAADLHCHFGPDPHRERSVDAFEAAREAAAAGHTAIVLKSHSFATPSLAWAVEHSVGGIRVFGGICCDHEVGGMNPATVEVALRLGAKIVWLPTLSSHQDVLNGLTNDPAVGGGITVTDPGGSLLPETREILDLVAESEAILATGHVTAAEHFAVVEDFARRGKVLVTHGSEDLAGPKMTPAQCAVLAERGAFIELCAMTCIGALASKSVAQQIDYIRAVGVDRVTLGTDFGQKVNPRPTPGFQTFADALYAEGVPESDIRHMACSNPCFLLGVPEHS